MNDAILGQKKREEKKVGKAPPLSKILTPLPFPPFYSDPIEFLVLVEPKLKTEEATVVKTFHILMPAGFFEP